MNAHACPSGVLANGAAARKIALDTNTTISASRRSARVAGSVERKAGASIESSAMSNPWQLRGKIVHRVRARTDAALATLRPARRQGWTAYVARSVKFAV